MPRIPYEIVSIEAEKILFKMVLAPSYDAFEYYDRYIVFINACGWTDREFDTETLRRVDAGWELIMIRRERKLVLN